MYCKYCKEYIGFNEDINCLNKDCYILEKLVLKYGVSKIVKHLKFLLYYDEK